MRGVPAQKLQMCEHDGALRQPKLHSFYTSDGPLQVRIDV